MVTTVQYNLYRFATIVTNSVTLGIWSTVKPLQNRMREMTLFDLSIMLAELLLEGPSGTYPTKTTYVLDVD